MKPDLVSGSPLWQTVFVSFAILVLLLQVLRGWRLGLPRQLLRIVALVAAYSTALFGGKAALPFLRPLLKVPDFVLSAFGGAILAMIVYSVINTVGTILFKRTDQQASGAVRLVWGISGAVLGLLFGLFFIWLMVVGIRSVGAVAEAQINALAPGTIAPFEERSLRPRAQPPRTPSNVPDQNSLPFSLARLKKSIELGTVGDVVKQSDVLPGGVYETLAKVGEVFAKPERASRFLSYPGVIELTENPKLLALRADPEITRMVEEGRLWELMQDDRLIEAANDAELAAEIKKFDLKKALDYAAKQE
jgi:hypothetical protein